MNRNNKLFVLTITSVFLSVHMQAMMMQEQEITDQSVFTSPAARQELYRDLLYQALVENNTTKIRNLLNKALHDGFAINSGDREQRTLLHDAALAGSSAAVKLLLEAGADPNSKSNMQSTPLHLAVMGSAELEVVQALIAAGADVMIANNYDVKPLLQAIYQNNLPAVKVLLTAPYVDLCKEEVNDYVNKHGLRQKPKYQAMIKLLDWYYTKLVDLSIDKIVHNRDRYQGQLDLLPQELQEKINDRLVHQ